MIFETLMKSVDRNELILVTGGMCHFHLRKDRQITIREIIVLPRYQRKGRATTMLEIVKSRCPDATSIFAKVPADLEANMWYEALGFKTEGHSEAKSGRKIIHWRKKL